MRIPLAKRIVIACFNILFPPAAVGALTGWTSKDTLVNSFLFLLAVFPSHIHGFFISWTYFNRKRKARSGQFPGKEKHFVYSEKVQTGGVGWSEYERLKTEKKQKMDKKKKRTSRRSSKTYSSGSSSYNGDVYPKAVEANPPPLPKRSSTQRHSNVPFGYGASGFGDSGLMHQNRPMMQRHY